MVGRGRMDNTYVTRGLAEHIVFVLPNYDLHLVFESAGCYLDCMESCVRAAAISGAASTVRARSCSNLKYILGIICFKKSAPSATVNTR